jgi:DNA polymerase-4
VDAARLGLLGLELADRVSLRARRGGWTGRRVTVKLRFPDFTTWTRSRTCREPLMLPAGLADIATTLLERNRDGRPIRLLGISLGMLVPDRQPALPSTGDRLFACRAALARRFGSETLIRAGSLEPGARTGSGMPADLNHGDPAFRADGP